MPKKSRPRKTNAKSKRKKTVLTRKAKPAARKPAERLAGIALQRKIGLAAVPAAMEAAALTSDQKRQIVHRCIAGCAGTNSFSSSQPLSTIQNGIEGCVEICVAKALHRPVSIRSTDTEDLIVGMI
jgi:hypothetical protein